jgi:hypothetical protein
VRQPRVPRRARGQGVHDLDHRCAAAARLRAAAQACGRTARLQHTRLLPAHASKRPSPATPPSHTRARTGEYAERIDNADELLEAFLETFPEETAPVQLQLLTATVKLFLKKPTEARGPRAA